MKTGDEMKALRMQMWKVVWKAILSTTCLALWILAVIFFAKGNYEMATLALVAEISLSPSSSP